MMLNDHAYLTSHHTHHELPYMLRVRDIGNQVDRHIELQSQRCMCGNTKHLLHMRVAHNGGPPVHSHLIDSHSGFNIQQHHSVVGCK